VISHPKSLAHWHKPTAKPGAFIQHRIGDFALNSYSLLIKISMADLVPFVNREISLASRRLPSDLLEKKLGDEAGAARRVLQATNQVCSLIKAAID
jgi:hypothetical protein